MDPEPDKYPNLDSIEMLDPDQEFNESGSTALVTGSRHFLKCCFADFKREFLKNAKNLVLNFGLRKFARKCLANEKLFK